MPKRENKATVSDTTMQDAFKQGFDEGLRQATGAQIIYEFVATFEGTDLRRVQFSDLDQALAEARELLIHGHGTEITITATAVPSSAPQQETRAVAAPEEEDDVEDAEVVEEQPSDKASD
jgi:hypothetical protein